MVLSHRRLLRPPRPLSHMRRRTLPPPARAGQATCRSATATASSSSTTPQRQRRSSRVEPSLLASDPLLQFGVKEGRRSLSRSIWCTAVMMGIHSSSRSTPPVLPRFISPPSPAFA